MEWKVQLTGDKRLNRKLDQLEPKLRRRVIVQAMRKNMKTIQQATKANTPVGPPQTTKPDHKPGMLRKSIKVRSMKRSRRVFGVEVRTGEDFYKGDQFYGAMVEFGTKKQKPQGFMKKAYEQHGRAVTNATLKDIWAGVKKIAREGGL